MSTLFYSRKFQLHDIMEIIDEYGTDYCPVVCLLQISTLLQPEGIKPNELF
jgi:hypothetical protein